MMEGGATDLEKVTSGASTACGTYLGFAEIGNLK